MSSSLLEVWSWDERGYLRPRATSWVGDGVCGIVAVEIHALNHFRCVETLVLEMLGVDNFFWKLGMGLNRGWSHFCLSSVGGMCVLRMVTRYNAKYLSHCYVS